MIQELTIQIKQVRIIAKNNIQLQNGQPFLSEKGSYKLPKHSAIAQCYRAEQIEINFSGDMGHVISENRKAN